MHSVRVTRKEKVKQMHWNLVIQRLMPMNLVTLMRMGRQMQMQKNLGILRHWQKMTD
jgi:hypothetical protein